MFYVIFWNWHKNQIREQFWGGAKFRIGIINKYFFNIGSSSLGKQAEPF
jgi:hypothetical protein